MKKQFLTLSLILFVPFFVCACHTSDKTEKNSQEQLAEENQNSSDEISKVYFTREISPESLIRMYEVLQRPATGKVAVKLSMGEPGGHNYLKPELIKDLVTLVNGTFIDANTAYGGKRASTEAHMQTAIDHGFTAIAPVDILDAEGEMTLPVTGGKHITEDIVGANYANYDFTLVLSHFKGHAMAGFGGAIKNISIGIASANGKRLIHSGGTSTTSWGNPTQEQFLETMSEAAKAIADHCGENILYISVMNNLSVDCDCDSNPANPEMGDIGILASLDPVALDKACVDQVYNSTDHGRIHLIERMESRKGIHAVEYAEEIGMGSQHYELIDLDN